jgi:hypothetical protein
MPDQRTPQENDYSNHRDQLKSANPPPERAKELEKAISDSFAAYIQYRNTGYIQFDQVTAEDLAHAFVNHPILVKPILACVNVAGRAIARDLQINVDTYGTSIPPLIAASIAGYIKPMLPRELAIPSLLELDRFFWTDKELRAFKGRWEEKVTAALNHYSTVAFRKRRFEFEREVYEIDSAYPPTGELISVAVDVKRIESPKDIHKRSDEIINKASKYKTIYPKGKFFAMIYYPFPSEHQNVESRLKSELIDGLFFAGETDYSISQAAQLLLGKAGFLSSEADLMK